MTPEQAAQKYYWCKYDKDTNTVELSLDNYVLSSSRICESMFYLDHLLNIKHRYGTNLTPAPDGKLLLKPWFFVFGEYLHWCFEQFYRHFKIFKQAPVVNEW